MKDYINKESWCKDGLHCKKFHYKYIALKRCPGCGDRNPDPINDNNGLSDINKDLSEPRRPSDPNRKRFT